MVCLPFCLLLFAIFEQGLLFYKSEILQSAVSDSARLIRTGQASAAGYSQEQYRQQICSRLPSFIGCSTVTVDVRPYTSFSTARPFRPVDASGNYDPTQTGYNAGAAGSIIVVSAVSIQPVLFPALNAFYSSAGRGKIKLTAQAAFRNEPF